MLKGRHSVRINEQWRLCFQEASSVFLDPYFLAIPLPRCARRARQRRELADPEGPAQTSIEGIALPFGAVLGLLGLLGVEQASAPQPAQHSQLDRVSYRLEVGAVGDRELTKDDKQIRKSRKSSRIAHEQAPS